MESGASGKEVEPLTKHIIPVDHGSTLRGMGSSPDKVRILQIYYSLLHFIRPQSHSLSLQLTHAHTFVPNFLKMD